MDDTTLIMDASDHEEPLTLSEIVKRFAILEAILLFLYFAPLLYFNQFVGWMSNSFGGIISGKSLSTVFYEFSLLPTFQFFRGFTTGMSFQIQNIFGSSGYTVIYNQSSNSFLISQFSIILLIVLSYLSIPIVIKEKTSSHITLRTLIFLISFLWFVMNFTNNNWVVGITIGLYTPLIYWYYLKYGDMKSFFENRIVIFSIRRVFAIMLMFIAIAWFTFFISNTITDPIQLLLGNIRIGRDQQATRLKLLFGFIDPVTYKPYTLWDRFMTWTYGFLHFDYGLSYISKQPVQSIIGPFIWETLKMQVISLIIAFTISVLLGVLAAYYHQTFIDSLVSMIALLGLSMPIFVTGILALLIFGGIGLNWFPNGGAHFVPVLQERYCGVCGPDPSSFFSQNIGSKYSNLSWWMDYFQIFFWYTYDSIWHLVLPVLTLAFATMATFARLTRGTMLEVMREDYILSARANGLSERSVIMNHALPNVMLPIITFLGLSIGGLLAGAPITETVFNWPGLGQLYVKAVFSFDINMVMAMVLIITIMILIANMLTDIVYTYLDPRISL